MRARLTADPQRALAQAKDYAIWRTHAVDLDAQVGMDKRAKRIINITVSQVDKSQQSRLLNYLTTPHLLVWSAVMASCSEPGLFPPVKLMTKDRQGTEKPFMAAIRWVDGAIQSD